jgi:Family of unknown function (DUF6376)
MTRALRAALLCLAAVAALALAACGGDDESNDYVDDVNAVQNEFLDTMTEVASTPPTNPSQAGDVVSEMEDAFATAADDLEAIDPPEEVADLHDELVTTMSDLGTQVADLGESLTSGNPQQTAQAATELQAALTEAQTEVTSLTDQINEELGG